MKQITVILIAIALSACGVLRPGASPQEIAAYTESADRPEGIMRALKEGRGVKGMYAKEVAMIYGLPKRINRSSYGLDQAVYTQVCQGRNMFQDNIYVYYEGITVESWNIGGCIY